jgi:hypothetical protein
VDVLPFRLASHMTPRLPRPPEFVAEVSLGAIDNTLIVPGGALGILLKSARSAGSLSFYVTRARHAQAVSSAAAAQVVQPGHGVSFIRPDAGGDDVFGHVTTVERSGLVALTEGQA